jgi:hypothetical protein
MNTKRLLAGGVAAIAAAMTLGVSPATEMAEAKPPCWQLPDPPPDCPDPPPPVPEDPPPIGRDVRLYEFDASALPAANAVADEVLDHVKSATRARMANVNPRITVHVVPEGQDPTDLPLWRHKRGDPLPGSPGQTYDDADGIASADCTGDVAVREQTIVMLPVTTRPPEQLGKVTAHEIGHEIDCGGLSEVQGEALADAFKDAKARGRDNDPSNDLGDTPAYTLSAEAEYFAEATAAWFNMGGPNSTYRRSWLGANDPEMHALLAEIYQVAPLPAYCDRERATMRIIGSSGGTVEADIGRNVIVGSPGPDNITGSANGDLQGGTNRGDAICGGGGNDTITAGPGDDNQIFGEVGNDLIAGGRGDDHLDAGAGADELHGEEGDDTLTGGSGDDEYHGDDGVDLLGEIGPGYDGDDTMAGGRGDDRLFGGDDEDNLAGGPGDDYLDGGDEDDHVNDTQGEDTVNGGFGNDALSARDCRDAPPPPKLSPNSPTPPTPPPPPPCEVGPPDTLEGGGRNDDVDECLFDYNDHVDGCVEPGTASEVTRAS